MKKIINYEKDILFKTDIGEISTISLEHDITVDGHSLKGDFIVSGEYKTNELSVNKESFNYKLPLEYELEDNVDLDTLTYDVSNFEYTTNGDELDVYIDFEVKYDEKTIEPIIPIIEEDEINKNIEEDTRELEEIELPRLKEEETDMVIDSTTDDDTYVTYHVHIVREGETLESIAMKYNVSVELIKEYNTFESLELKSKLIIPEINE